MVYGYLLITSYVRYQYKKGENHTNVYTLSTTYVNAKLQCITSKHNHKENLINSCQCLLSLLQILLIVTKAFVLVNLSLQ